MNLKDVKLTPNGLRMILFAGPTHEALLGGALANVSPASLQAISHALAVMLIGGSPESKTGEGSFPDFGGVFWNRSVETSIAYCHGAVASNSRSAASGCCEFRVSTLVLRGMSYA